MAFNFLGSDQYPLVTPFQEVIAFDTLPADNASVASGIRENL